MAILLLVRYSMSLAIMWLVIILYIAILDTNGTSEAICVNCIRTSPAVFAIYPVVFIYTAKMCGGFNQLGYLNCSVGNLKDSSL